MSSLNKEIRNVQNPALGAMLLWRFVVGYSDGSDIAAHVPLPLMFIDLPIMLHKDTVAFVTSTNKPTGLRGFVNKFNESRTSKSDLITSIHQRALQMRELTSKSLALALSANLIAIDAKTGLVAALSISTPKFDVAGSVRELLRGSEKIGYWCSKLTMHEISVILKVVF